MASVIYTYNGKRTIIQCNYQDKFKEINTRFIIKSGININDVYFIYNGKELNNDYSFNEVANEIDKKKKEMNILVLEKNVEIIKENIIKSKEIICPECFENTLMKIKDYKIELYDCKNRHRKENILLNEFNNTQKIDLTKIICKFCNNNRSNTFENKFFFCIACHSNICPLCKSIHDKSHQIINYENKSYICSKHNLTYIKYCKQCKENLCMVSIKEHKNHNPIDLSDFFLDKESLIKERNEFKNYIEKFQENCNNINTLLNVTKNNIDIFYQIYNNLVNNYDMKNINYEILENINEIKNYNNIIIKDIENIIQENDINKKFKLIYDIYNKMNNKQEDYFSKINHKFINEPQKLKYKFDITNSNDPNGLNDIFEVFTSYKDNKEYIVSKNINFNLDIYNLLENKKILSLEGHKNTISTIRYFINNKDYNEYLISADYNKVVIIWDITNNYNIKHKININYKDYIYSCLLVFPHNQEDNYIVTSTYYNDEHSVKIYSMNKGNFVKNIFNRKLNQIKYLLLWQNKKNNKYYIIQVCNYKVLINNLMEDEIYAQLTSENEGKHNSAFLYSIKDNDYLCCSSNIGYIDIWDLYNKKLYNVINTNKCVLMHIIEWNNKYSIVADMLNNSFKIVDLEKFENILDIGEHKNVRCVKKIYHPKFGESLLTAGKDNSIKLWSI